MHVSNASLLFVVLASCTATDAARLTRDWPALENQPVQVAALVVDLDRGETLLSRNERQLLRPASTMKLLTTAAICRRVPDASVSTSLQASAFPNGSVALLGGGDPFLSTADVQTLVAELKQRGLRTVTGGRVHVADPLFGQDRFGEGWMWDDEPASFMPAISGAAIDGGCVTVVVGGGRDQPTIQLLPVAGDLKVKAQASSDSLRVRRGRYQDPQVVTVTGSRANDDAWQRRISVPDPARMTGWVLADALRQVGVLQAPPVVATGPVLDVAADDAALRVTMRRPMHEIVRKTNKASDNLGAELLLRYLARLAKEPEAPGDPAAAGLAVIDEDLAQLGLDAASYRVSDGSGVSHYTLISAEVLVRTLVAMHRLGGRAFSVFEDSLPIAGTDGTLASRMKDTAAVGRVRAKTGTISGVSNLAGYVTTKSGRRLAFAILVQNFVGPAKPWRDLQDQFCVALAEL